jgi:HlyD family secretion protein
MKIISRWYAAAKKFVIAHKVWSAVTLLVVVSVMWWGWSKLTSTAGEPSYVLGTVASGTVVATVSESGQVAANQQLDITPQVSGQVVSLSVVPGQSVHAGQAVATIDPTDALQALQSAQENLQSAQLSLAKLQEPATALTLAQQQDALTQAQQSLTTLYQSSFSDVTNTFLDLPAIMSGLQDINLGTEAGGASQWNIDYYSAQAGQYNINAQSYRNAAYNDYLAARNSYNQTFGDFKTLSSTPDHTTIEKILSETYQTDGLIATAVKSSSDLVQFYIDQLTQNGVTPKSIANTQINNLSSYLSKSQSHLTTLLSDTNTLASDEESINEKQLTLQQTQAGPDAIDVQTDQLNVQKAQDAVVQAQQTLDKYYVTAPFAGTIASVPVNKYDQASSGTTLATLITNAQYADLSVNEVDAAKLQLGQKATLTFDAIPDLTLTGTVAQINAVGTVTQGVVTYDVKISFDAQDARVKSGMTVNASIQTAVAQNTLVVPSSAVHTQGAQSYVQVFEPSLPTTTGTSVTTTKTPVSVPVTIGISDNSNTQIVSGLTAGEQVVVRTSGSTAPTAAATATTRSFGGGGGGGAVIRGL